jgi:hypothetical protein
MSTRKVYARLNDAKTKIVEYPVLPVHIRNRAHPLDWYTEVQYSIPRLTKAPPFHKLRERLTVRDGKVYSRNVAIAFTVDELLKVAKETETMEPETRTRVLFLMEEAVRARLNDFAKLKGYDSIVSVISYIGDPIETYNQEAIRARELRSQTWDTFYNHPFIKGEEGVSIPASFAEIQEQLPVLTW